MSRGSASPNPLGQMDAGALTRVMAVLEGHLVAGDLDPHVVDQLNDSLQDTGHVQAGAGRAELRVALTNLNLRLRYVLGEYDHPPAPDDGQVDLHFGFPSEADAVAFAEIVRAQGRSATSSRAVDARAYVGEGRWEVAVRTTELPLSAEFDSVHQSLRALAAKHAGSDGGWGGPAGDG